MPRINFVLVGLALACVPQGPGAEAGETGETTEPGTTTSGTGSSGTTAPGTSTSGTTTGSAATTEDPTGGEVCSLPPLPEEVLPELGFGVLGDEFELQPGKSRSLAIGRVVCCYFLEPVEACVAYSVEPDDGGASIDPVTGMFTVAEDAVPGSVYTVTADVEAGRALLAAKVLVWTPESNPLVGIWREVGQLPCGGGPEVAPEQAIEELWFRANGEVSVTWTPFEIYFDYWADYTFDLIGGTLAIADVGGNYVPNDLDGVGSFALAGEELVLKDMWLGSPQAAMSPANCGHRFTR